MLAVLGRRVDVGGRVGVGHGEAADLLEVGGRRRGADQRLLGLAGAHRRGPHAEERETGAGHAAAAVDLDRGDDAREREVAAAAGDLLDREAGVARPHGEVHRAQDLVLADAGGPRAEEELRGGDGPGAARTRDLELGVERERDRRQLRRRVGVGDRTAHGAAVADLEVTDERDGLARAAAPPRPRPCRARPCAAWSSP